MEYPKNILSQEKIDIKEYYSVNVKSLWRGLKSEHISFWLLCIYFFFEYVRPQTAYPSLDILPWAQIFLILTLAAAFIDKSVHWVSHTENKLLIAYCLTVVISGILAFDPASSWAYRNTMLGWLIVYYLLINIVNTERRLILFLLAYLLFSFKMGQHGTISWASRGFSFAAWGLAGGQGWFRNSGELAIQMLIYGSLAIAFVVSLKSYWSRYKKWFLVAAAATGYITVIGASSRGSQIALGVIVLWFLLKQEGGVKKLAFIAGLLVVMYLFLPAEQIQRFHEMGSDKNSLQRLTYWKIGIQIIKEHPFFGIGYNSWISYLSYLYPEGVGVLHKIEEQHNIYIQAASETGIIGLLFFLSMTVFAFLTNSHTRKISESLNNNIFYIISYGLDAGLIGFLVAGTFVTVLYYPFFWVQIAMIVTVNNVARKQKMELEKIRNKHFTGKAG